MIELVEKIIHSPEYPAILKELNDLWNEEQRRRREFYDLITEQQKAEFIEGEIIMHSPVRNKHVKTSDRLYTLIFGFVETKELGMSAHEKLMVSLTRNDFEPDICFFRKDKSNKFTANQLQHPTPDFVVEILSKTTEAVDRKIKYNDYALHGVEEYWIVDADKEIVEQYILENSIYQLNFKAHNGIVSSKVIEGFTINVSALWDANDWQIEYNKLMSN